MKCFFIFYFSIAYTIAYAQSCTPTQHNLVGHFNTVGLVTGQHDETRYIEEDLCSYDGWLLVFKDDFNESQIDPTIWFSYSDPPALTSTNNFSLSNGSLFLTSTYDQNAHKTISPGLQTKRNFPAGKFVVRAKLQPLPDQPIDIAPLWMYTQLDYTNANTTNTGNKKVFYDEMDIEFMRDSRSTGIYTLHSGTPPNSPGSYSDGAPTNCLSGSLTDGNWHIFEIEWDIWHVNWYVDGILVNSLSRTYQPHDIIPILIPIPIYLDEVDECAGVPGPGLYYEDYMFPSFANMPVILGGLGDFGGQIDQIALPYTMEVDYVKVYRKITCDKSLTLPPTTPLNLNPPGGFRSAGGINCDGNGGDQMPPTIDNQTPSIITGGTITVAGQNPYIFKRDDFDLSRQDLNLYATESVTLLPGFETNLLYLDQAYFNNPCSSSSSSSIDPCCKAKNIIEHYYGYNPITNPSPQALINPIQDVFSAEIVQCPVTAGKTDFPTKTNPDIPSSPAPISQFNINLYPNPAQGQCTVRFAIPESADVTITLSDMTGREVGTIDHSWHTQGTSFVPFSTESFAPGIYMVRYSDGTHTSTQRLTIAERN